MTTRNAEFRATTHSFYMRDAMTFLTAALQAGSDDMVDFYIDYARHAAGNAYRTSYTRAEQVAAERMGALVVDMRDAIRTSGLAVWNEDSEKN